jgi:hypothetical protein
VLNDAECSFLWGGSQWTGTLWILFLTFVAICLQVRTCLSLKDTDIKSYHIYILQNDAKGVNLNTNPEFIIQTCP